MSYFHSILLGLVQGLGEFLPISSSAHLVITPWLFDFKDPGLTFDVALHFGTLLALLVYFWRDWWGIGKNSYTYLRHRGAAPPVESCQSFRLLLYLVVATLPGAVIGYLLDDLAETTFRHPLLIAFTMVFLGVLLFWADWKFKGEKSLQKITWRDSIIIGLSQAMALIPGVSRSGITMTTGLFMGLDRVTAARFSFLLAAPITLGAFVFKAPQFFAAGITGPDVVGILVSAIVGFLSIKYLLKFVQTYSFRIFVYYRLGFSVLVLIVYFVRS